MNDERLKYILLDSKQEKVEKYVFQGGVKEGKKS